MNEYVKKAVVGFDGQCFYEGIFKGKSFLIVIHDKEGTLFSEEKLTEKSVNYRNGFKTKIELRELEDLVRCKMFARYNGNEYKVQMVAPCLETLELLMREGFEKEDHALGFKDNVNERLTDKIVSLNEIEGIRVEKKSVYKDFCRRRLNF